MAGEGGGYLSGGPNAIPPAPPLGSPPSDMGSPISPPASPSAFPPAAPNDRLESTEAGRGLGTVYPPKNGAAATAPRPTAAAPSSTPPAAANGGEKTFDLVPVYYGTDRGIEPNDQRLMFGLNRAEKLQLGRAMISVPSAHKVPNIERPWAFEIPYFKVKVWEQKEDPAKHFMVQEIVGMTEAQLLAAVKARLDKSETFKNHAFVFVHGFNTSFDNALYRTAQIAYDLNFDGAPFVYCWPSGGKVASYNYDRGSAEAAEPYLEDFLKLVVEKSGAKSISLIAHSMGNELLLRVLERARPTVPKGVVISQVILAAPDVDRNKFSNIAKQITNFAKGVTLYAASNDRALYYSGQFWGVPRAGDVPSSGPMIVPDIDTIDVTAVSTDSLGINHSGYAENPELLKDIKALIQAGVRPPDKRIKNVLTVESAGGKFWRYPPPSR
ncbi:MAG: alpha/beta hydrolase [Hyphomicrobium sp.]